MQHEVYIQAKLAQLDQRRRQEELQLLAQLPRRGSLLRHLARTIGHTLVWSGSRLIAYGADLRPYSVSTPFSNTYGASRKA